MCDTQCVVIAMGCVYRMVCVMRMCNTECVGIAFECVYRTVVCNGQCVVWKVYTVFIVCTEQLCVMGNVSYGKCIQSLLCVQNSCV